MLSPNVRILAYFSLLGNTARLVFNTGGIQCIAVGEEAGCFCSSSYFSRKYYFGYSGVSVILHILYYVYCVRMRNRSRAAPGKCMSHGLPNATK